MNSITWIIIVGYLALLMVLGLWSRRAANRTSADFFVINRSVGPVLLLLSIFGTTMTGFALVGSTGKAYSSGIGVYGLMASWSGLMHSAVFFLVGIRLWAIGKRHGYLTQCEFFRERFQSPLLALLLFPLLVLLVIPYLLVGVLSAGKFLQGATVGMFPVTFAPSGSLPAEWGGLLICAVVLFYVFVGGLRGAVWANAFQTVVFMLSGMVAFFLISQKLGGLSAAMQLVMESESARPRLAREGQMGHLQFLTYALVPLSVGMFPHLFQHWLTAKSAKTFRLTVVAHPLCILLVWLPCILIGVWAAGYFGAGLNANTILGRMVGELVDSPVLSGLVAAGVLAAIMSSLDSQFVCLGTMFTQDVLLRLLRRPVSDSAKIWIGRGFIVLIVAVTYGLSLALKDRAEIFALGVWCFTGFAALFPLVLAAVLWKRATRAGAIASLLVTTVGWLLLFTQDLLADKPVGSDELLILGMMPVAPLFLLSGVTLVIVSLLTRPPDAAVLERFFPPSQRVLRQISASENRP